MYSTAWNEPSCCTKPKPPRINFSSEETGAHGIFLRGCSSVLCLSSEVMQQRRTLRQIKSRGPWPSRTGRAAQEQKGSYTRVAFKVLASAWFDFNSVWLLAQGCLPRKESDKSLSLPVSQCLIHKTDIKYCLIPDPPACEVFFTLCSPFPKLFLPLIIEEEPGILSGHAHAWLEEAATQDTAARVSPAQVHATSAPVVSTGERWDPTPSQE